MEKVIEKDLLDGLLNDWKRERPDLDAIPMAIVGRIIQLGRLLEKSAGEALKEFDIHYTDLDVLATLRRSGEPYSLTPTELRRSVLITSGAMTALLDRLEMKSLIDRVPHELDGRIKMARLTENGRTLIDSAIKTRFREAKKRVENFNKGEILEFSTFLRKMSLNIEKGHKGK